MINQSNYFVKTEVVFKGCKIPKRDPDYISESGSRYWYGDGFVIRASNHWCKVKQIGENMIKEKCVKIASCRWHLKTTVLAQNFIPKSETGFLKDIAGKAYYRQFKSL